MTYSERTNLNFLAHFFFIFRTATARGKAEQSDMASIHARDDASVAHERSEEYGGTDPPEPTQPFRVAYNIWKPFVFKR